MTDPDRQLDIFGNERPYPPDHPMVGGVRGSDPDTSRQAARSYLVERGSLRFHILQLFADRDKYGLVVEGFTDDELVQLLDGRHPGSVSKRRGELVEMGYVTETDLRRPTRYGVLAVVWAITPDGHRALNRAGSFRPDQKDA